MSHIPLYKHLTSLILVLGIGISSCAMAAIDTYEFDNPRQEAQYRALIEEFRCPKCQNQNLAGSDAPIAQDLKSKTYELVKQGRSDAEIRQYMQSRYGDFISYKPPVRPSTWILWFFPPLLLCLGLLGWYLRHRQHKKRANMLPINNDNHLAQDTMAENTSQARQNTAEVSPLTPQEAAKLAQLLSNSSSQPPANHRE